MSIICDRCGQEMNDRWKIEGMPGDGGNCAECGDNLCAECGGKWGENGECELCAMSLEELEAGLPEFITHGTKETTCFCGTKHIENIIYVQKWYKSDNWYNGKANRKYQISYVDKDRLATGGGEPLIRTDRHRTIREALIEAHKMLNKLGVKK